MSSPGPKALCREGPCFGAQSVSLGAAPPRLPEVGQSPGKAAPWGGDTGVLPGKGLRPAQGDVTALQPPQLDPAAHPPR